MHLRKCSIFLTTFIPYRYISFASLIAEIDTILLIFIRASLSLRNTINLIIGQQIYLEKNQTCGRCMNHLNRFSVVGGNFPGLLATGTLGPWFQLQNKEKFKYIKIKVLFGGS